MHQESRPVNLLSTSTVPSFGRTWCPSLTFGTVRNTETGTATPIGRLRLWKAVSRFVYVDRVFSLYDLLFSLRRRPDRNRVWSLRPVVELLFHTLDVLLTTK